MIHIFQQGDLKKTQNFLTHLTHKDTIINKLIPYAEKGVRALMEATPVDTGLTASSWSYQIVSSNGVTKIQFLNSNIQNGCPIAVMLQYGHLTGNGGWVEGRDYINPAIQPIFDEIASTAWKEVIG